jgi:hypothetical protein
MAAPQITIVMAGYEYLGLTPVELELIRSALGLPVFYLG